MNDDNSLPDISQTNLYRLLKSTNFEYTERSSKSGLVEKDEMIIWHQQYLESIKKYREKGRHLLPRRNVGQYRRQNMGEH